MKILTDWKFLGTLTLAFVAITAILIVVHQVLGQTTASFVAVGLAGFAIEIFRRFEDLSRSTDSLRIPRSSLLRWEVLIGILVIQTATFPVELWTIPWKLLQGEMFGCNAVAIGGGIALDWLGFLFVGYLVGRMIPNRALTTAAIGVALLIAVELTGGMAEGAEGLRDLAARCWGWETDSTRPIQEGMIIGLFIRGFVTIWGARIGSQTQSLPFVRFENAGNGKSESGEASEPQSPIES